MTLSHNIERRQNKAENLPMPCSYNIENKLKEMVHVFYSESGF